MGVMERQQPARGQGGRKPQARRHAGMVCCLRAAGVSPAKLLGTAAGACHQSASVPSPVRLKFLVLQVRQREPQDGRNARQLQQHGGTARCTTERDAASLRNGQQARVAAAGTAEWPQCPSAAGRGGRVRSRDEKRSSATLSCSLLTRCRQLAADATSPADAAVHPSAGLSSIQFARRWHALQPA